ncbi:MAG: glycosyltransferase, partial [Candidatus Omnitrophota bacterium]|nr:glycosyltransferase [Candidatus Omnitrophota bacterium]
MKVLLLTTHLNIGGIGTYTVSLAKALKAKGYEVYVASSGGVLVNEVTQGGVSHIKLDIFTKSEVSLKVFKAVFDICKLVKKLDIDIIHAQTRVTHVIGFFVSLFSRRAYVTTCHGFFKKNIGRALLPAWGSRVIAISEAVEKHLIEYFDVDKNKISLIYNGIDIKKFLKDISKDTKDNLKDKFGIRKDHSIIGTVGRFTPDKGQDVLVYALYEILKQKPNVQLVLVGEGKEKSK